MLRVRSKQRGLRPSQSRSFKVTGIVIGSDIVLRIFDSDSCKFIVLILAKSKYLCYGSNISFLIQFLYVRYFLECLHHGKRVDLPKFYILKLYVLRFQIVR